MGGFANVGGELGLPSRSGRDLCGDWGAVRGDGEKQSKQCVEAKKKEAFASSLSQIFCRCTQTETKQARQRQTVSFVGLLALARRKEG